MLRWHVYFDEDVPLPMVDLLRDRGLTVHLPQEIGTVSAEDPVHLQRCVSEGWTLITRNRRDFRRLHWFWMTLYRWGVLPQPHSGILTVYGQQFAPPEEWAAAIHDLLQRQPDLQGLMYMWRPSSGEWERQAVGFM